MRLKEPKKRVLLVWSGGLDSTALICDYLDRGWTVDALHVAYLTNKHKAAREKAAVTKMYAEYFQERDVRIHHCECDYGINSSVWLPQFPTWLWALLNTLSTKQSNQRQVHDEVAIGYVRNDIAISYIAELQVIWKAMSGIVVGELPPLAFPLMKTSKRQIYDGLPWQLRDMVTWCEDGQDAADRCGTCAPCVRMRHSGFEHLFAKDSVDKAVETNPSDIGGGDVIADHSDDILLPAFDGKLDNMARAFFGLPVTVNDDEAIAGALS